VPAFDIDPASSTPVFEQIVHGLRCAIASGVYRQGEQLPSVRQLAVDLLVNPNTVAKAYRELEREGLTRSRKGLGVFVANRAAKRCVRLRRARVVEQVRAALGEAARSGLSPDEIDEIIHEQLDTALRHLAAPQGALTEGD